MLINFNKSYQSSYVNIANSITGFFESKYNDVQYYFQLKNENKSLVEENAQLKSVLIAMNKSGDTSTETLHARIDTLYRDSLKRAMKYVYMTAKVVNNSLTNENNYITIQKGSREGVKIDMAVDGPQGIVGRVVAVSANYSVVMSLLNHNSKISAMMKKNKYTGIVDWDGRDPSRLQLHNIPKSILKDIKVGDSVITSNLSDNFPPGLMVGKVLKVTTDPASNFLGITLSAATNFYTLQYVYLIYNTHLTEQRALEDSVKAKIINK